MPNKRKRVKLDNDVKIEAEIVAEKGSENDVDGGGNPEIVDLELLGKLQYKVDAKVWTQVTKQLKVLQSKDPDIFQIIMKNVQYLVEFNRDEKTDHQDYLQIYEKYVAHFLLSISSPKKVDTKKFKDPLKSNYDIETYFEFVCAKQYYAFATLIFNYAKKSGIELQILDSLSDPCNHFVLSSKLKTIRHSELVFMIMWREKLDFELDMNNLLMSSIRFKCYPMITPHMQTDFVYDEKSYLACVALISKNFESYVDMALVLPIFSRLATHLKTADLTENLKSVFNFGLKNGLKILKAEKTNKTTKKIVAEIKDLFKFEIQCSDENYELCFGVLEVLAASASMPDFFELGNHVLTHIKATESEYQLQKYVKAGAIGSFLAENNEKFELNLDCSEFYEQDEERRKRYTKGIGQANTKSQIVSEKSVKDIKFKSGWK